MPSGYIKPYGVAFHNKKGICLVELRGFFSLSCGSNIVLLAGPDAVTKFLIVRGMSFFMMFYTAFCLVIISLPIS